MMTWTIAITAFLAIEVINAGSRKVQLETRQSLYEEQLSALSQDRDIRAKEAARAQSHFNLALKQVAQMQEQLLALEDKRRELETGIDVIQNTLRQIIKERDIARSKLVSLEQGENIAQVEQSDEALKTVDFLVDTLKKTSQKRDDIQTQAQAAEKRVEKVLEKERILLAQNAEIFAQLEEAVSISVEPLEKMFKAAGISPDNLIKTIRSGYSGQGGPMEPLSSSDLGVESHPDEERANAILASLDEVNIYRLAAFKTPFAFPLKGSYRLTSTYGNRKDPFNKKTKFHNGTDFAAPHGTPIIATGDGVVTYAGWKSGYGRYIKIKHALGTETGYGHLSKIHVKKGDRVSLGETIGAMGNTGRSTGTHLHYEIRVNGKTTNPMTFIKAAKYVF